MSRSNSHPASLLITEWECNSIPKADGGLQRFFEAKGLPALSDFSVDHKKTPPVFVQVTQWIQ